MAQLSRSRAFRVTDWWGHHHAYARQTEPGLVANRHAWVRSHVSVMFSVEKTDVFPCAQLSFAPC